MKKILSLTLFPVIAALSLALGIFIMTGSAADYLPGDVNGDGTVNGKDVTLIRRYNADWDVELNLAAADVNADGVVNGKDITLIRRYNANWDVVLLPGQESETENPTPSVPATDHSVDISSLARSQANWPEAGYTVPLVQLGYNEVIDLGYMDLSGYAKVRIQYACDSTVETTGLRFLALNGDVPIGLKSTATSYGQAYDYAMDGDIAHTDMVFSDVAWAAGARWAEIDLTNVTYKGNVYVSLHNPEGTMIAISAIEFISADSYVNTVTKPVQNPVAATGEDPWVIRHGDKYYYCYSSNVWFVGGVAVAEVDSLDKLGEAQGKQVFQGSEEINYLFCFWAPELHYLNGEWYIYVAAEDPETKLQHMIVLKGTSQDPTEPFEYVGRITDSTQKWGIDGTILQLDGELYYIWSGWEGDVNVAQNLYIAHMSNPWTIDSHRVCLSVPEYDWEKVGEPHVNEGPTALQHNGRTFVTYSASGSWTDDYCLGLLTLVGNDPLNPAHWQKSATPVFAKVPGLTYGPGHNSFTTAADGSVWMVYHSNETAGAGWTGRSIWIAPVTFDANGNPRFGKPERTVNFPVAAE